MNKFKNGVNYYRYPLLSLLNAAMKYVLKTTITSFAINVLRRNMMF